MLGTANQSLYITLPKRMLLFHPLNRRFSGSPSMILSADGVGVDKLLGLLTPLQGADLIQSSRKSDVSGDYWLRHA